MINGDAGKTAPSRKTQHLTKTEYRSLFTASETILIDKTRSKIDGDLSYLSNIDNDAAAVGFAGVTYRDILRSSFNAFADADDVSLDYPETVLAVTAMEIVGLVGTGRAAEILEGLPL